MERKEKTIRNAFRCIRVVAVASALTLVALPAIAQVNTGVGVTKTCNPNPPATVAQGASYTCTFQVVNETNVQIDNLVVSDLYPFPGGTLTSPVACTGGLSATSLAAAGSAGDSCGGTLNLVAPAVACGTGSSFIRNQVNASAVRSDNGTPVGGGSTNGVFVARVACDLDEFCRTPGFWGTHANADPDKACSQPITETVLEAAGGSISICGEVICNTLVDDASSAVEALCVRVKTQSTRQLARQLTAARLNCIVSGESGGACNGVSINEIFDACNTACAADDLTVTIGADEINCIDALDCFNNGNAFDPVTGICAPAFACSDNGAPCTPADLLACADPGTAECLPIPSCHDQEFPDDFLPNDALASDDPCFEKQGPAGSSEECKGANKTPCTIIQPGEDACDTQDLCL